MNKCKTLFKVILERNTQTVDTFRKWSLLPILRGRNFITFGRNYSASSSLFLTTVPAKKRDKWSRFKVKQMPNGPLIVSCKKDNLNHYQGMSYGMFEPVPLASKYWRSRHSKGDHFTILPAFVHPAFTSSRAAELPKTFEELKISPEIIQELEKMEVYNPTVIQAKSIIKVLEGNNVLITAETGCGKTLAYVIPVLNSILNWRNKLEWRANSPFGIILLPSIELATQVGSVVTKLGHGLGLHCVMLIKGDFENIAKDPSIEVTDVIISTMGILMQYLKKKIYTTERCKHLVLDEADIFFEREFLSDLRRFLSLSKLKLVGLAHPEIWPDATQLVLTSATAVKNISEFENSISINNLEVASTGYLHKVLLHVRQQFLRLNKSERPEVLLKIIRNNEKKRIATLVFSNKTNTCDFIHQFLNQNGVNAAEVNGSMFSDERLKGFMDFKEGKILTLVCTDCMSRGLDMPWVKQVINFDFPNNIPSYIHRCGRVGRLGYDENCLVTNFVSGKNEIRFVNEIEKAARTGHELTLSRAKLVDVVEEPKRRRRRKKRRN